MNKNSFPLSLIIIGIVGIVLANCIYTVDETEQVVITEFGKPIRAVQKAGLKFKKPYHKIIRFDRRILEWDGSPDEIPTLEKKIIWVDVTGRWRIQDPLKFFETVRDEAGAQSRLDDALDSAARNLITGYRLIDIVRSSNQILEHMDQGVDAQGEEYERIEMGRDKITKGIFDLARENVKNYGIELLDIRIKRVNYNNEVRQDVFARMISERKRAAAELRALGNGERARIDGQRERDLKKITSEAYREVQKIRGEADAEAMKIYGEAYSKDPDFYAFMKTLEKYPDALKGSRLVLSTDSEFLSYLKNVE